jgi:hypothetical protein
MQEEAAQKMDELFTLTDVSNGLNKIKKSANM